MVASSGFSGGTPNTPWPAMETHSYSYTCERPSGCDGIVYTGSPDLFPMEAFVPPPNAGRGKEGFLSF